MKVQAPGRGLDATLRDFVAGQKLFNRYTLSKILGRGGMGVVWLARDNVLEREVALKFLPEIVLFDRAMLSDLKQEANRSLELTHKNIVRIYDLVHDEKTACISMEHVDGDTLSNIRVDRPRKIFECWELGEWTKQLCEALDYAHNHARVVHRDLKPSNLMVNLRGDLKVTDFGIARSLSDSVSILTAGRHTSGTLVYMSPQQLDGARGSPLDDIYSFGATMYELLTGKPPFYSGNIDRQIHERIAPPMAFRREELDIVGAEPIDEVWEYVVAACLQKDPAVRPQSALEIVALLTAPAPKASSKFSDWLAFPSRKTDQKTAPRAPVPSTKTKPKTAWTQAKIPQPKRESRHTFRRAWLALCEAIFAIGRGFQIALLAVLRAIAAIFVGIGHGLTSFGQLVANDVATLVNGIGTGLIAIARGAVLIVVLPARAIFRLSAAGIPALGRGVRSAGVTLGKGSAVAFQNLAVGARLLGRETIFGTAITIIPAAIVAASIWFFAIRTPPPRQVVEQKPAKQLNQTAQAQPNVALIEPAKPAPPLLPPEPKAPESKPPPPPQGALSIDTTPSGAKVIVDASIIKTTPASISDLPVGKHHLQIVMPDYVTEERDVDVKDGEVASQGTVALRRIPPPVASAATVTADGVNKPVTKSPEHVHKAPKPTTTPPRQVVAAPQPPPPAKTVPRPTLKPAAAPTQKPQRAFEGGVPGD